ncbi:GNAT family N-acetyltransferase [Arthrobacter sp. GCM10027362]|uniref:GNAT family N-acetyltransferase n=1 Tax=Arthrobacter sp. GCM10027362 TaxID=3273379 RepID=UPI0036257C97
MRIEVLSPDADALGEVYAQLLRPAFPADELESFESLRDGMDSGSVEVVCGFQETVPVTVAVGEWFEASRVMLLGYMATAPAARGQGFGRKLYRHVITSWTRRHSPCLVLAEVEHPAYHSGSPAYGDPSRRLQFYGEQGARIIELPYFQPALRRGAARVPGMLLLLLTSHPPGAQGAGELCIPRAQLRDFIIEYLMQTEGSLGNDLQTRNLLRPLNQTAKIRTFVTDDLQRIPVCQPG